MRLRNIRYKIHVVVCLSALTLSPLAAQESPTLGFPDAQTTVAEWIAGGHPTLHFASAAACPGEHPWYRAVVNGMAAIVPTDTQTWQIAAGWQAILRCNDAVVNAWFSRALGFATGAFTGKVIAEALVTSDRPEHLSALRAAIVSEGVSDDVRGGILLGVSEAGELSVRADVFLVVFQQDKFPRNNYFAGELNELLRSEMRDEFVATAAEEVRTHPEGKWAGELFNYLAFSAAEPRGSPYAVSDNARRNVLRVLDEIKRLPVVAAARERGRFGIEFEQKIRGRVGGG